MREELGQRQLQGLGAQVLVCAAELLHAAVPGTFAGLDHAVVDDVHPRLPVGQKQKLLDGHSGRRLLVAAAAA
jgi:hypothetical protein